MLPNLSPLLFKSLLSLPPKPFLKPPPSFSISTITTFTQNPIVSNKIINFCRIFQQCSAQQALKPGKIAHGRMIVSDFVPTVFVSNCLIQMYTKCAKLENAQKVFDEMPIRDTVSWNSMIFGYVGEGDMMRAQSVFDFTPQKDIVSWNSLISGYLQNGDYQKTIDVFKKMGQEGVMADRVTFAVLSKACSSLEDYYLGIQFHGLAVVNGFDRDVVSGSALLDMYAKCRKLNEALLFFREMPEKNWVSWSAAIAGSVQNEKFKDGLNLFKEMQRDGVGVSQSTYASVFRACAGLSDVNLGSQLHAHSLKADFESDIVVGTATVDMYAKCDHLLDARKIFNSIPNRSRQSFNAMIIGYARSHEGLEAFLIFRLLLRSGLGFDEISLSGAFSSCAVIKGLNEGLQLHGLAIKSTFHAIVCVSNAILDMYGKCKALDEACRVFDEMEIRDAVSWNAIIAACGQNENEKETLSLLVSMLRAKMEPDEFTYGSVLKACAGQKFVNYGKEVHSRIIKSGLGFDIFVGSAIVDMYCKCSHVEEANKLHERIEEQTMVSWNSMISGFTLNEQSEEAQKFFSKMLAMGFKPDNFTYATVLDTCASMATVSLGKQIHAQVIKHKLQCDVYISSTLVDMYSKCGNMLDSRLAFDKAPKRDFVTWNAMICGYAQHGLGEEALYGFKNMQLAGVKPNHATFVSVLRACAHMGLVKDGFRYFYSMSSDYGLCPQLEHYSCVVDFLGRSGQVLEALKLIHKMPFEADDVIWRTLLSNCKMHGNVEVAEEALSSLLKLDPQDSSAYILLSNIYADEGMWEKMLEIRKKMRGSGLKKEPGCSWIEVKSELHMFRIADKSHPRYNEIYDNLDLLICDIKWAGYVPETDFLFEDEDNGQELIEELISCM